MLVVAPIFIMLPPLHLSCSMTFCFLLSFSLRRFSLSSNQIMSATMKITLNVNVYFILFFFCCFSCSSFHWFCFSCLCCAMWISKKILYEIGTNHKTITNEKMKLCAQTFFHVSFSFFFSLWRMKVKTPNESSMILL